MHGEDADYFRPERWLEASDEQLVAMERANLAVSLEMADHTRAVLLLTSGVRPWNPNVPGQEYLDVGNMQTRAAAAEAFRSKLYTIKPKASCLRY